MLLRQTILYLPAQVMGPIVQVVSAFAWTHVLAPTEMGLFALVSAAQELAFATALLWFSLFTVRYFDSGADAEARARFHATEGAVLAAALIAMAVGLATIPLGASGRLTGNVLAAGVVFVVSRSLVSYMAERARAESDALGYTVLQTAGPVAGFLVALGLVMVLPPTAATVLWGYAIAQVGSLVFALRRMRLSLDVFKADPALVRASLTYGLPLLAGGIFAWVANNGIRFLVEWKDGLAAVGLLTVGWALGLRAAQFASMLTTAAAFPLAVRRYREDGPAAGQAQLERNGVLLVAVMAPALAGLYMICEPLIRLIVAVPYQAVTREVLRLALLAGGVRNLRYHFPNQVFLLHGKPMPPVLIDGLDALLTMLLGALGLWMFGLTGAVAGGLAAAALTLAIAMLAAWRDYRFTFPSLDLARLSAAVVAMMLAVSWFGPKPAALSLMLAVGLGGAVYAAALAILYPGLTALAVAKGFSRLHARLGRAISSPPSASASSASPSSASHETRP